MSGRIYVETSRERLVTVARRWRAQYGDQPSDPRFGDILSRLDALDIETATPDNVEEIIGNTSWTREYCGLCGLAVTTWVRLGEEPDYESNTFIICPDCLRDAHAIVKAREPQ